jgi:Translocon-associated protein beta (TRAPB)
MRSSIRTALAVLLLVASIAAPASGQDSATSSEDDEYAEEEKAFLIVRKAPLEDDVVVGSNLTVVIDIHNAGSRCAAHVITERCLSFKAAARTASPQATYGLFKMHVARPAAASLQCRVLPSLVRGHSHNHLGPCGLPARLKPMRVRQVGACYLAPPPGVHNASKLPTWSLVWGGR